jgi:hypothetical protein
MKKALFLSTSTNNVHTVINSLRFLGHFDIEAFHYDKKYHEGAASIVKQNQQLMEVYRSGALRLPPDMARMDTEMIEMAKDYRPDFIFYISAWTGDFVPYNETLREIGSIAPLTHLIFDGSDPPWWQQLHTFEELDLFRLTVNIDGNVNWPGGHGWDEEKAGWKAKNSLTLLTPLDPSPFLRKKVSFRERPFVIAYNGNGNGWIRSAYVHRFQNDEKLKGRFFFRPRSDNADSYEEYIEFMKHCQIMISVPHTGSGTTKHVKGRILEAGLSGCCVLELANAATRHWFQPRRDYWEYGSIDECVEFALFLADHPMIAEDIGMQLKNRIEDRHSPASFWSTVFTKLGEEGIADEIIG